MYRGQSPRVGIAGFGPLPLPLIPQVAELLHPYSEPAPYGRGGETLVDPEVRRCRQIDATKLELSASDVGPALAQIVAQAAERLGVEGDVEANLGGAGPTHM